MPSLMVQTKVKDYPAWRSAFDADEPGRVEFGITNGRVYQSAESPNEVVLIFKITEMAKAKQWMTGPNLKKAIHDAGVNQPAKFKIIP